MGKFTLKSLNNTSRAAILSPMAGSMEISSNASIGVAEKQELAFVGIESILEKTLSVAESIKLLSCFTVDEANTVLSGANANNEVDANTTPMYDVGLSNETDFTTILKSLINTASQRDANHGPSSAVGDNVSSVLGDGLREYLNSLLASNGLLDLLEASNVLNIQVELKDTEGAKDMYDVIRGNTSRVTSPDAKAKRRLFLTQIPKATLDGYLFRGTGNESIKHIDFLPLKGGDSMTFVFDILVRPPQNLTAVGKNASADDYTGANIQNDPAYVTQQGKYTDATVSLNGEIKTRRVAFVAHFGTQAELFPQDFSDAQIEAVTVPAGQETVAGYTAAFGKVAGAKLVGAAAAVPASLQSEVDSKAATLHKTKTVALNSAKADAERTYNALQGTEQDALVEKVKAKAVLDSQVEYRASLSSEYTLAIAAAAAEETAITTQNAANNLWSTNAAGAGGAWSTAQAAALDDLLNAYTAIQTISNEIPELARQKADAFDEGYPNVTDDSPKRLATLSSELAAARIATISAENLYQNYSGADVASAYAAWQTARSEQVTAEEKYAKKVLMTTEPNRTYYATSLSNAQNALGNAVGARNTKKAAYIAEYQTSWSLVNGVPAQGSVVATPFVDPANRGTPVAYTSSRVHFVGYQDIRSDTVLNGLVVDRNRLKTLYENQDSVVGDKNIGTVANPVYSGYKAVYVSKSAAYDARVAAENDYKSKVTNASSVYNVGLDALSTFATSAGLSASAISSAVAAASVSDAQAAYDLAKKNIAKAQARFNIVSSKVTNYERPAATTTTLYMPSKVEVQTP